jgi:hypothetical protein
MCIPNIYDLAHVLAFVFLWHTVLPFQQYATNHVIPVLPFSSGERNDKNILNGQRDIVSYNITKAVNPTQLVLFSLLAKRQNKADGDRHC